MEYCDLWTACDQGISYQNKIQLVKFQISNCYTEMYVTNGILISRYKTRSILITGEKHQPRKNKIFKK